MSSELFIQRVKEYRSRKGCSLMEAKCAIENEDRGGPAYQDLEYASWDAPRRAPAQEQAKPSEPMTTDEAREYLIQFMEKHFTDTTFHRYIGGTASGSRELAGDFAWQMATALRRLSAPAPTVAAPSNNEATRLVCLEAAQKLRTYVGIYTGDKQARRLVDELSNIADALAAPTGASQSAGEEWQPISSAPRDGRSILIRFGQDTVSQAKYIAGLPHPWQFIDTQNGITWMINHAKEVPGGPSHWMPMPALAGATPTKGAL